MVLVRSTGKLPFFPKYLNLFIVHSYGESLSSSFLQKMYQSNFMREICDEYGVNAFGLRKHILRTHQRHSNWDLIKKFCRQELPNVEGLDELYREYYIASVNDYKRV